jgi:hypothetical protein
MVSTSRMERNVTLFILFLLCAWWRLVPSLKAGNAHGNDNEMKGRREEKRREREHEWIDVLILVSKREKTTSRLNTDMQGRKLSPLLNYGWWEMGRDGRRQTRVRMACCTNPQCLYKMMFRKMSTHKLSLLNRHAGRETDAKMCSCNSL